MQLQTLGGLRLEGLDFKQHKLLVLLSYLSLEGAKARDHLAELFWPEGNRMKSLSMALTRLRQGVGDVIENDTAKAWAKLPSDAQQLLEALDKSQWQRAAETYAGAFLDGVRLEDWSAELEDWVYTTREYLAERVQYALLNLAEEAAKHQDFAKAGDLAERAYTLPGLGASEVSSLKRLYPLLCAGNNLLAPDVRKELEGYGIIMQLSREEAKALFKPSPASQLPKRATSFVGRSEELKTASDVLDKARLLTILGTAGVGKTRLALQLAHERQAKFERTFFVPLESVSSPSLLVPTVLSSLELKQQNQTESLTQLADFISERSVLLVLDNLEHLTAGANFLSELLARCPGLKLLTTSRERLNLAEEHLLPLEGLAFPRTTVSYEEATTYDSVQLFLERAKQLQPQFDGKAQLKDVLRICTLLEGLPLGIELAASWVRLMPCAEIADEIARNLDFLTGSVRNVPERQRSLRAAFEYSWKLLNDKEQEVLRNLSVFVGGFRREAAAEVTGATIAVLTSLVNKSLLRVSATGRYEQHPLVYQYSQEKLREVREQTSPQEKHGTYYMNFLDEIGLHCKEGKQQEALAKLDEDIENALLAWQWATSLHLTKALQDAQSALAIFFEERGRNQEGERFFADTVTKLRPETIADKKLIAFLLANQAWFLYELSDFAKATHLAEQSLELMRSYQEGGYGLLKPLNVLACVTMDSGKFEEAKPYCQECVALARNEQDEYLVIITLMTLAGLEFELEEWTGAERHLLEAIVLARKTNDLIDLASLLNDLGRVYFKTNRILEAITFHQESLNIARPLGLQGSILNSFSSLAEIHFRLGYLSEALDYTREGLELAHHQGNKRQQSFLTELEGQLYKALNQGEKAKVLTR